MGHPFFKGHEPCKDWKKQVKKWGQNVSNFDLLTDLLSSFLVRMTLWSLVPIVPQYSMMWMNLYSATIKWTKTSRSEIDSKS